MLKIYTYLATKKSNTMLLIFMLFVIWLGIMSLFANDELTKRQQKTKENIAQPDTISQIKIEKIEQKKFTAVKQVRLEVKEEYDNSSPNDDVISNFINLYRAYDSRYDSDILELKRSLSSNNLLTDKFLIVSTIKKETKFQNIRSYTESDIIGFPQMKLSTIFALKRIYTDLPLIRNSNEFLNNVNAQVLYCDAYYHYMITKYNLSLDNRDNVAFAVKCYNGGEAGYSRSLPSYFNSVTNDYFSLKDKT